MRAVDARAPSSVVLTMCFGERFASTRRRRRPYFAKYETVGGEKSCHGDLDDRRRVTQHSGMVTQVCMMLRSQCHRHTTSYYLNRHVE